MVWVILEFGQEGDSPDDRVVKQHVVPEEVADLVSADLCSRRAGAREVKRMKLAEGAVAGLDYPGLWLQGQPIESFPMGGISISFASVDIHAICEQLEDNPQRSLEAEGRESFLYRKLYSRNRCIVVPEPEWLNLAAEILPREKEIWHRATGFREAKMAKADAEKTLVDERREP